MSSSTPDSAARRAFIRRFALRAACPVVVYAWLLYLSAANRDLKGFVCLIGMFTLFLTGLWTIRHVQRAAEIFTTPENRAEHLRLQLLLGKRLGGCLCGVVLGVGLCFLRCDSARFLSLAVPILLSGSAAMAFLGRQTAKKLARSRFE